MAPSKKDPGKCVVGSSRKRIKTQKPEKQISSSPAFYVPEDVVEHILAFFPITKAVQSGLVSTRFKNTWLYSRVLDFGRDFALDPSHPEAVQIIDSIFQRHLGDKIQKFVLFLDYTDVQDTIESWILKCVDKGLEELELDFLDTGFPMIPISLDFSAIETLRVLKLSLCNFQMRSDSKGLKFLRTLVLTKIDMTSDLILALFNNCFVLETLEVIGCRVIRELKIRATNHKRFRSLVAACCPQLQKIDVDSPTLQSFKYCGLVYQLNISNASALEDVMLHYVRVKDFTLAFRVLAIVLFLNNIHVLTTTNIFLEGLTRRITNGRFVEVGIEFPNLKEFQLFMESPSYCNLYDIACFLKRCPSLERVYIDINDYTFETGLYFEVHQKHLLCNFQPKLSSIKFVEIKGFKCHSHELDIVQFFLENATTLDTIVLVTPKKNKARMFYPDMNRVQTIRNLSPQVKLRVCEDGGYKSPVASKHSREWSL